jgi:Fe-S oxidoreductase
METHKGERFCDLRIDQALGLESQVLATACPYCITMLEDSRITMGVDEKIEIKDITEIIQEVM